MGLLFTSLLLGGAAWLILSLSGAAWPPPSLGRGAFTFVPLGLVLFFLGTGPTQRMERKAARPKEGEGQAAPPAREWRESRTTEREEEGPPLN